MGITERKQREKKEMRELILATAAKLFLENGYEKTSIRNIAEAIEYSPTTIYLYFKDKNELFYALSEEGFRKFFNALSEVKSIADPLQRLRSLGEAYISFAINNPDYYDLMFLLRDPMEAQQNKHEWSHGQKSHDILTTAVQECIELNYFKEKDARKIAFMIWSMVHGAVSFKIRDRMKMYEDITPDTMLRESLAVFNRLLQHI